MILSGRKDLAKDYIEGMWKILQYDKPDDFLLATGVTTSVREFCLKTFQKAGLEIEFKGEGTNEKGIAKDGRIIVEVDPAYFRPTEVDLLLGDAAKARNLLNWLPRYDLDTMIEEMVQEDIIEAEKESVLKKEGYKIIGPHEI